MESLNPDLESLEAALKLLRVRNSQAELRAILSEKKALFEKAVNIASQDSKVTASMLLLIERSKGKNLGTSAVEFKSSRLAQEEFSKFAQVGQTKAMKQSAVVIYNFIELQNRERLVRQRLKGCCIRDSYSDEDIYFSD